MKSLLSRKLKNLLAIIPAMILGILCFSVPSHGQDIEATIKVLSVSPARIRVEGKVLNREDFGQAKNWSFLKNYADATRIEERIENFALFDDKGAKTDTRQFIGGEYVSIQPALQWKYEVKTEPPAKITDSAHISWISKDHGLLMLADLLPELNFRNGGNVSAKVTFDLPGDWKIETSESLISQNTFSVSNVGQAVFLVGKNFSQRSQPFDKTSLGFAVAGDWQFTTDEAFSMAVSILREHERIFREIPTRKAQIILLPFPQGADAERWRAETRGSTVVIISGVIPLRSVAIQRLHEQLRHEIFHFWMPNALALQGNYDWFYEGFAIYHALRTGVELNQIRFEDFLNTLGRAYDLTQITSDTQAISLIEASEKRWANASNFIYAKGMVVAFLCDLAIIKASKGKRNLSQVFGQIYRKHRFQNLPEDANKAILNILRTYPELNGVIQNYIEGRSVIKWDKELESAGIAMEKDGFRIKLRVVAKPAGKQKDLLDKLGYNQWRKLLQKTI